MIQLCAHAAVLLFLPAGRPRHDGLVRHVAGPCAALVMSLRCDKRLVALWTKDDPASHECLPLQLNAMVNTLVRCCVPVRLQAGALPDVHVPGGLLGCKMKCRRYDHFAITTRLPLLYSCHCSTHCKWAAVTVFYLIGLEYHLVLPSPTIGYAVLGDAWKHLPEQCCSDMLVYRYCTALHLVVTVMFAGRLTQLPGCMFLLNMHTQCA